LASDLLIKQKFLDHREWNINEANRDFESMKRWMEMRTKYTGDIVVPFAIKHTIVMYPDENDHKYINFTQQWIEFYNKEKPNIEAVLVPVPKEEQHHYLAVIEFFTLRILVKYIGMSDRQFCELPTKVRCDQCGMMFIGRRELKKHKQESHSY
jgi:hypothetical protein